MLSDTRQSFVLGLVMFACLPTSSSLAAEGDSAKLLDTARREVNKAWADAVIKARRIAGSYVAKETDRAKKGEVVLHCKGQEKAYGEWFTSMSEPLAKTVQYPGFSRFGRPSAEGRNSSYAFRLDKGFGQKEWVLRNFRFIRGNSKDPAAAESIHGMYALQHFHFNGVSLDNTLSRKGTILNAKQGPTGVRVDIDRRDPDGMGIVGHVILDPSAWWCVKEFQFLQTSNPAKVEESGRIEYVKQSDAFPLLVKRVARSMVSVSGKQIYDIDHVFEYKGSIGNSLPESDFALSSYGLPEPAGAAIKRPIAYFWFFVLGAACLVASLCIGWYVRRRSAVTARQVQP